MYDFEKGSKASKRASAEGERITYLKKLGTSLLRETEAAVKGGRMS